MAQPINFGFLVEDVKRQRELAQQALDEAKRLDELIKTEESPQTRERLESARQKWLEMARALAENADTTSTVGSTTISIVSRR